MRALVCNTVIQPTTTQHPPPPVWLRLRTTHTYTHAGYRGKQQYVHQSNTHVHKQAHTHTYTYTHKHAITHLHPLYTPHPHIPPSVLPCTDPSCCRRKLPSHTCSMRPALPVCVFVFVCVCVCVYACVCVYPCTMQARTFDTCNDSQTGDG